MDNSNLESKLINLIEKERPALLKLCCDLIKARSENPPGDVSEAASVAEDYLKRGSLKVETYEPAKGHMNLLTTIGAGERTLILNGHIDVVPTGDAAGWSFPPLLGEIREDKILGRGASDMKSGVAAILTAMTALAQLEEQLPSRVVAAIVCDEETGGEKGTRWLVDEGILKGDACLIAECTGREKTRYAIEAGERGVLWLRLKAKGKPAHGSTPMLGRNAILMMTEVLPKIRRIENLEVTTPQAVEELITIGRNFLAKEAAAYGAAATGLDRLLDHYSVNVGVIQGGTKTNVVPESCQADIDIRIPQGGTRHEVERYLAENLPENFEYEVKNFAAPSYTPPDAPLVKAAKNAADAILHYSPPAIIIPATSDAHIVREKLKIPTISFGPGYSDRAHVQDEYVRAEDVVNFAKIYTIIATKWLGEEQPK